MPKKKQEIRDNYWYYDIITPIEAAHYLSCSLRTLKRLTDKNKIKVCGVANRRYYKVTQLQKDIIQIN